MASIGNDPGGRRRILFVAPDGSRKTIRLGKMSKRDAEQIKRHVEALLVARVCAQPLDRQTALWLEDVQEPLLGRLAAVGLIESAGQVGPAEPPLPAEQRLLGPFLRAYILSRPDVKPATLEIWQQPVRNLVAFFGDDRTLSTITPGDAEQFAQWLLTQALAPATIAKRLAFARTFLHVARKHRLVDENPFTEMKIPAVDVTGRQRFVGRDVLNRLLAVADPLWRTILALARLGGLRCPSEVLSLEWRQVDWERGRITVPSPKTDRYAGKASREIPLFADLRLFLEEARELALPGQVQVVSGNHLAKAQGPRGWRNCNLHTAFGRLIKRAGMEPWPRLFHNLRSSRETELLAEFPPHVVARWMGHDVDTAMRHYAQVTDDDFTRAAHRAAQSETIPIRLDRKEEMAEEGVTVLDGRSRVLNSSSGGGGGIRTVAGSAAETLPFTPRGTCSGTLPEPVLTILDLIDQLTGPDRALLLAALCGRQAAA